MSEALDTGVSLASTPAPARLVDQVCDGFEVAWKASSPGGPLPRIEDYLHAVPQRQRAPLCQELIKIDIAYRRRQGEEAVATDYARFLTLELPVQPNGADEAPVPLRLGRYRIAARLGAGGFGVVYRAYDEELRREVAIKVQHPKRTASAASGQLYLAEARMLANLDHPGIVPVYDVGRTEDGTCYSVSKLVPGTDLGKRLRETRFAPAEAAELIARVAEALHHAHQRGLVHRDIKPANILLDLEGNPILADFGLALREEDFGQGPAFAGTPSYMSPEQARGEGHRVDARSDVYSLGAIFYELLTGQRLVQADSLDGALEQITSWEPRPPRQIDSAVPKELDRVCLKALCKRASDRYSIALDLAQDLRHWQAGQADIPAALAAVPHARESPVLAATLHQLERPPALPTREPADSEALPVKIVPKGLRAFDVEDADFFVPLLPGPRDRDGLPDSIRFWKTRLEEMEPDRAFSVGLIYGPSGCGKSSFVKAGLLPRLAGHVIPIYVEATPSDTEARLLVALRKRCPPLSTALPLPEVLTRFRRGQGLDPGKKVVLVLDQFEQYLHAGIEARNGLLVPALRQCDGRRVQCLVMVRDDFWMAATRFMRELEVRLVENQNSLAVDLFDARHARKVLAEFGRSFGALPDNLAELTREQERFLDQAIASLARDDKVIPVRLALFAEMVKARPWTPAIFKQLGGMEGIGVTFLEETFSARTAPPEHRLHQKAARAVLKALLPQEGTDLKAHMIPHRTLLEASEYAGRPREFEQLLHILDTELRLVTPTDPEGVGETENGWVLESGELHSSKTPGVPPGYYQLTHDHLVPALRQWLTRKQRETRRGRMELRLAERADLWNAKPESRRLPGAWESLNILLFTRKRERTAAQKRMLRAASRLNLIQCSVLLIFLIVAGFGIREWTGYQRAAQLVRSVLSADMGKVPDIVNDLSAYRRWADPLLLKKIQESKNNSRERLHARLALLPVDRGQLDFLRKELLETKRAGDLQGICETLKDYYTELVPWLWNELKTETDAERRFNAAIYLAYYDPGNKGWAWLSDEVANHLIAEYPPQLERWIPTLNGVRWTFVDALKNIFSNPKKPEYDRVQAARIFAYLCSADRAAGLPLLNFVLEAEGRQYQALVPYFLADRQHAELLLNQLLSNELDEPLAPYASEEKKDSWAKRQAHAAVVLLQLARGWEGTERPVDIQRIWPLLRQGSNPGLRTYLIHRLVSADVDPERRYWFPVPERLIAQYDEEEDLWARRALLLTLGGFDEKRLPIDKKEALATRLLQTYAGEADPGLHSIVGWVLCRWGKGKSLDQIDRKLAGRPPGQRGWYITKSQGHTLAVFREPGEISMGSPPHELGRSLDEELHRTRMDRPFALATREVTVKQFQEFLKAHPGIRHDTVSTQKYSPAPDGPMLPMTWYQAAQYCRWLSEQEGLREDEMCYPPVDEIKEGMTLPADFLARTGFRLPTEAEWEYACRAGTTTSRHYGGADALLGEYAWYAGNSEDRAQPVGSLKPNDFGLFDMYGNAWEWCQDALVTDSPGPDKAARATRQKERPITDMENRVLRGGCFASPAGVARSAHRFGVPPKDPYVFAGLRVARTLPRNYFAAGHCH